MSWAAHTWPRFAPRTQTKSQGCILVAAKMRPQRLKPRSILRYLRRGLKPRPFKTEPKSSFPANCLAAEGTSSLPRGSFNSVLRAAKFRKQGFPALEGDAIHAAKDHTVS